MRMDLSLKDTYLLLLCEVLEPLDQKLIALHKEIKESCDPDGKDLLVRFEHVVGLGFVAMQHFLYQVMSCINDYSTPILSKTLLLKFGLQFDQDLSIAKLIHEGADWWKHEMEWWRYDSETGILINPNKQGEATHDLISKFGNSFSYPLGNILYLLVKKDLFLLMDVVPLIDQWANDVLEYAHHQKSQQGESC